MGGNCLARGVIRPGCGDIDDHEPDLAAAPAGIPSHRCMSVQQVVIESPTPYETPEALLDLSSVTNQAGSQESYISSVHLSPHRVNSVYNFGVRDVFRCLRCPRIMTFMSHVCHLGQYQVHRRPGHMAASSGAWLRHYQLLTRPNIDTCCQSPWFSLPAVVRPDEAPSMGQLPR